jgi:hypothetical protein
MTAIPLKWMFDTNVVSIVGEPPAAAAREQHLRLYLTLYADEHTCVIWAEAKIAASPLDRSASIGTLHPPDKFSDTRCQLGSQTGWQIMPHSFDQDEFRAGNGIRR